MKKTATVILILITSIGLLGCQGTNEENHIEVEDDSKFGKRELPRDPAFDAIYERFGNPDRVTGSAVSYLHYDLKNGQTLTLGVGGKEGVFSSVITKKK